MHAGRVVISQGAEPQRLYCIGSGECKVLMKTGGGKMLQIAKLGPGAIFGEVGVLFDCPHTASVVTAADVTLFTLQKVDVTSAADPRLIEMMREQANEYADEEGLLHELRLTKHWNTFKTSMISAGYQERKAATKAVTPFGRRPAAPPAHALTAKAGKVVRASYSIATDGTPVSRLDMHDLQSHTRRREQQSQSPSPEGFEAQMQEYLATRPGGDQWRGNAYLREYVKKEEEEERAARSRALLLRGGSGSGFTPSPLPPPRRLPTPAAAAATAAVLHPQLSRPSTVLPARFTSWYEEEPPNQMKASLAEIRTSRAEMRRQMACKSTLSSTFGPSALPPGLRRAGTPSATGFDGAADGSAFHSRAETPMPGTRPQDFPWSPSRAGGAMLSASASAPTVGMPRSIAKSATPGRFPRTRHGPLRVPFVGDTNPAMVGGMLI